MTAIEENDVEKNNSNENFASQSIQEKADNGAQDKKSIEGSWSDLKFIPNNKRFLILAVVIGALEITGLFLFAYVISYSSGEDLTFLGIFLLPPFCGAFVAYFVESKKEAVGISSVNALTSIVPFMIIYTLIELYARNPVVLKLDIYFFLIPFVFIFVQILVAFTIARMRVIYKIIGDSSIHREEDDALIADLKLSRKENELEMNFDSEFEVSDDEGEEGIDGE